MKHFLFALALLFTASTPGSAQVVVDGVNINNLEQVRMIRMIAQGRFLSNRINIFIDYGQSVVGLGRRDMEVNDPNTGDRIRFNSVMHAVNFLILNGWEYQEAMILPNEGNASATGGSVQYIFTRSEDQ